MFDRNSRASTARLGALGHPTFVDTASTRSDTSLLTEIRMLLLASTVPVTLLHAERPPLLSRRDLAAGAGYAGLAAALPASAAPAVLPFTKQPGFKLNTGQAFPTASFGLQVYDDNTAQKLTTLALEVGYRNFFSSVLARNQVGFARAIKASGIPRDELFICGSVLSNRVSGFDAAKKLSARGCQENMEAFAVGGIDYLDSIMLDYPGPSADEVRGQWEALEEFQASKLTRSISVSNFNPRQLDVVICHTASALARTTVAAQRAPSRRTRSAVSWCRRGRRCARRSRATQRPPAPRSARSTARAQRRSGSASSLTRARRSPRRCAHAAASRHPHPAPSPRPMPSWLPPPPHGRGPVPQTKTRSHFEEDLDIFDFKLTAEEIARLAVL